MPGDSSSPESSNAIGKTLDGFEPVRASELGSGELRREGLSHGETSNAPFGKNLTDHSGQRAAEIRSRLGVAANTDVRSGSRTQRTLVSKPWFTRRRVATGVSLLVVLIAACLAGAILASAIQRATENLVRRSLLSVLAANEHSLKMMFSDLRSESERYSKDEVVRQLCRHCLQSGDAEREQVTSQLLVEIPPLIGSVPWVLLDQSGQIASSSRRSLIDLRLDLSKSNFDRLHGGQSTLVLPQYVQGWEDRDAIMVMVSPLMDRHQCYGAFGWVMEADDRFSHLLQITRSGETDESYAMDGQGRLLSSSRFEEALGDKGFPRNSVLNYEIRDPGYDVLLENAVNDPDVRRPLTRMADQATRRADGMDLSGYRNYRGAMVVGAWKWLPDLEFAVVTEMELSEAYLPATILRRVLIATLAGVVIFAGIAISLIAYSRHRAFRRLQREEEAIDGRRIGQYRIVELLGVGGMGSVYRGRHEYLRRDVAIKVLEGEQLSSRSVARFHREVQLTSTLRHPNTIAIFDFGQYSAVTGESQIGTVSLDEEVDPGETFYYVMEYIDGISLQQLIDFYGPQSPERTVHFLLQICGSIAEAHKAGLIHRDIKPANILVSAHGGLWDHIKVLDFGLVKDIGGDSNVTLQEGVTRADSMTGTPLYMAPETIRDPATASPRGDIYSIGSVGYALLTGRPIFDGDSVIDLCLKQLEEVPRRPEERVSHELPNQLQDILMRCLDRSVENRFASVAACTAALESLPEAGRWTQAMSADWWENEFEQAARTQPGQTKNPTLDDAALTR
ncbi:serine/threonine protein kinase [Rhodopirellula halodulae]|uniref:serine/threonine protein kinase n=1 Tax=Rhodopirellula halodulae TaxID=2894198 RepID=UPI001E64136D|nr:serine/threonine protein kinase [Rhodopirellula sp. JC737]MCC9655161.1 serine/threonine protein kinase [Rhodopirellula sp. JC737]